MKLDLGFPIAAAGRSDQQHAEGAVDWRGSGGGLRWGGRRSLQSEAGSQQHRSRSKAAEFSREAAIEYAASLLCRNVLCFRRLCVVVTERYQMGG